MSKTPKLRFKEFSGDWQSSKGNDLFSILGGAAFSSKDSKSNGVKWFKIANVGINTTDKREISYLPNNLLDDYSRYILNKGDITLALTRPILNSKLKICIIDDFFDGSLLNQRVGKILTKDSVDKKFIYYLIQTEGNIRYLENMISGTDPPNLSNNDLLMRVYNIPSKEEQEKVASFFSLIDDKISLQSEKLEMLKDYKKGMMQKIFSRELRFKDDEGRNYPEWEEKKLGDIADIVMGQSPSSSCYNEEYEGLPLIQGNADIKDRRTSPRLYTSEITKTCDIGDIIMSVRAPVGAISISLHNACIGRGVCSIKPKYNVEYIYQFLLKYESKWSQVSQGSTFESVSSNDIKSLKVPYPNLAEQKKIGSLLRNMDEKIEKEQEKLNSLNEYKKGLLQQMFI